MKREAHHLCDEVPNNNQKQGKKVTERARERERVCDKNHLSACALHNM